MEVMAAHYLFRRRWYGSVLTVRTSSVDPQVTLIEATALVKLNRVSEALTLLEPLLNQLSAVRAALLLMQFAHNSCQVVDREALERIDTRLKQEQNRTNMNDPLLEALVHYLCGEEEFAQKQVEQFLQSNQKSSRGLALLGWLQLSSKKTRTALRHFQQAIQMDKENGDALMGEVKSLGTSEALSKVNTLVVRYPKCVIPLMEKMQLQLEEKMWQEMTDTTVRAMGLEQHNILALEFTVLKSVIEGKYEESVPILRKLRLEIENQEPKAWWLYMEIFSMVSRCCGRNQEILSVLEDYVEAALKWGGTEGILYSEASRLQLMCGKKREAESSANNACKLEPAASLHLARLTAAHLAIAGLNQQTRQEIEFLQVVGGQDRIEPELCLLLAMVSPSEEDALELLDGAVSALQAKSSLHKFGPSHLIALDPDLLVQIAMAYSDTQVGIKRRTRTLTLVSEVCPGLMEARLDLVRCHLRLRSFHEAAAALEGIQHPSVALLAAEIHLQLGEIEKAASRLELGLSENLSLKEMPGFYFINGLIAMARSDYISAIGCMKQALVLNKGMHKLSDKELGMVYTELSSAYMKEGETDKAEAALYEAHELLKNTDEEGKLKIQKAHLLAVQGNARAAIQELSHTSPGHPYFVQNEMKKAEIYLKFLKDERGYKDCYQRLVDSEPTPENLILLGDAYLAIQEPDLAIKSYEKAMQSLTENSKLMCKLARVLVKCHQYHKAIKSYRSAGEEGRLELGELLIRLGELDPAAEVAQELPTAKRALLLAKIEEKKGKVDKALKTLVDAQTELLRGSECDIGQLFHQMGSYATSTADYQAGIDYFKKSLAYRPGSIRTQVALAKLYMQVKDLSSCETLCSAILSNDPSNEAALLMVADLSLRRLDLSAAAIHFSSLLQSRPDFWLALARLIQVNRRSARIEQSWPYIEAARSVSPNHPALHYCTGLYYLYCGEKQKGLEELNMARGDIEWGRQATHDMVEAYLASGQAVAAERLLTDIEPSSPDEEGRLLLLTSLVRLALQDRTEIDRAISDLTHLATLEQYRVGATLGLGQCYFAQKQYNRAKVLLKQVARTPWTMEEAEYLERLWLLLAELHITNGNSDLASELLNKVLLHNQSSAKAYELLGLVAEKEQKYQEASQNYKRAWDLSSGSDPALGYKLSYNLLKNKQFAESVAICQKVLASSPEYPKIKKDILEKALKKLRI
ncbi:tetratricopeptide repeat protein 21B [Halyomorpha halys]|uniref:tetratricopeptide repeat protein 21B n=1 Tax=Halyomorpha halys TaxID=286706 RepID=UPI000D0C8EFC|nr:tetratricopeptide repeat protein 21B-like isoform X1 [Halyomorpha halys]